MADEIPFHIRVAGLADAEVIAEFNRRLAFETESLALDPPTVAAGVRAVLAERSRGIYFVAESAGAVIGQLMITLEYSDWRNGELWWIQSVYVRADRRRGGVFRALHRHAREEARRSGAVGLRLYVEDHNTRAQATYRSLGMRDGGYRVMEEVWGGGITRADPAT